MGVGCSDCLPPEIWLGSSPGFERGAGIEAVTEGRGEGVIVSGDGVVNAL